MSKTHKWPGQTLWLFVGISCIAWLVGAPTLLHAQAGYCEAARLTPCVDLFEAGGQLDTYGGLPSELAAADFNSDGHLDLVATDMGRSRMLLYLGGGDGTFESALLAPSGPSMPYYLAVGDLDGDGAADVAASISGLGVVSLLFGDGAGGFPRSAILTIGWETRALAVSDLNGDGRDDLIVSRANAGASGSAYVYFGPVNEDPAVPLEFPIPRVPLKVEVTDLNGNGHPDVVILGFGGSGPDALSILYDFTETGPSDQGVVDLPMGATALGFAVADLNHDQRPDFAVADAHDGRCLVLLADEHGGFQVGQGYPVSSLPHWVQASDLNRDGLLDLLVTCQGSSTVFCLLGRGDGTFVPQGDYCIGGRPWPLVVADFNEDGWPDVAAGSPLNRSIDLLLNRGLPLGTPFGVTGTIVTPPGRAGGEARSLLRIELPHRVAAKDVDIHSIRFGGKQLTSLRAFGPSIVGNSQARQLILRIDPAKLTALNLGDDATALTGCLKDGRPFAGPIHTRRGPRRLDRLARAEPSVGTRALGDAIQFSFPGDVSARWTVRIFNVHGGLVWSRSERVAPGGVIVWDQTSRTGRRVPSGVYFYRAESNVGMAAGKLPVLR